MLSKGNKLLCATLHEASIDLESFTWNIFNQSIATAIFQNLFHLLPHPLNLPVRQKYLHQIHLPSLQNYPPLLSPSPD